MGRRPLVSVVALAALVLLAMAAWWWQRSGAPAPGRKVAAPAAGVGGVAVPVVEVAPARAMTLTDAASAVGSLQSRQGVVLRPEVAGRITQLNFRDGQRVRRGQLLVQLDDRLALAQVQQNRAELGIAESNHRRNVELAGQGFISARAVDESQAALAVARAKLELAQASAARLKILAPFAGVAGIRNVHVGDVLQAGAEIVHLEDLDAMLLDFRLPERYQGRVQRGQISHVTLDALPGHVFEAVIDAIDPLIDAQGRSIAVRACLDNREGLLRPGMFARVEASFGERADAVMVPEEAVLSQGGNLHVYRLQGTPAPGDEAEVTRIDVSLGARLAGWVEVVRGVAATDRVVSAGQQRLTTPTARVRLSTTPAIATDVAPDARTPAEVPAARDATAVSTRQWHRVPAGANPCAAPGRT
ncbi:MAG TPA: efflux RND transporter periplasmic adaptor subunit [Ottowia sp.]|uniref:efflux RND transporter periplasmic adaptor subunit n=1 Tax=Ottowia sp. TaxID=1898956 RepID=UPI002CB33FC8|nr:efflux RND transporter periplasmic adaptor subunit [Ottowia sp.]HMN21855.1 efflux RND transporter periplasmic adaptor subunit [Ottowia sp.]